MHRKNLDFDNQYNLTSDQKVGILKLLTETDCVKIGPNDNPLYPEAEVYAFIKTVRIDIYGEEEPVELYIKMYLNLKESKGPVVVISFHKEGSYD